MTEVAVVGAVDVELLSDLATRANQEIKLAEQAGAQWLAHALATGTALLQAWEHVPVGQWSSWVASNIECSKPHAMFYMRAAVYAAEVKSVGARKYDEVAEVLRGLPALPRKLGPVRSCTPTLREQIRARHSAGESWRAIGADLGVSATTAHIWADPEYAKRYAAQGRRATREHRQRRAREREALRREESRKLVRAAGGEIAAAYADVRRALARMDRAITAASDPALREGLRIAMGHAHRSEDAIVAALRRSRAATTREEV